MTNDELGVQIKQIMDDLSNGSIDSTKATAFLKGVNAELKRNVEQKSYNIQFSNGRKVNFFEGGS